MACLQPLIIKNPKYRVIPFSGYYVNMDGEIVDLPDDSSFIVPCGKCSKCLRRKRNDIVFRLYQEYLHSDNAFFITLTVDDEHMPEFENNPKLVFRKWFEHIRYKFGKSIRHWIISELGSKTQRLHFHGLIFNPPFTAPHLAKLWPYGYSFVGFVNERTINYVSKYMTKPQLSKDGYEPFILQSNRPGLGYQFLTPDLKNNILQNGPFVYFGKHRINLPRYYFNKLFTEDERRKMAISKQDEMCSNPRKVLEQTLNSSRSSSIDEYLTKRSIALQQSKRYGNSKI